MINLTKTSITLGIPSFSSNYQQKKVVIVANDKKGFLSESLKITDNGMLKLSRADQAKAVFLAAGAHEKLPAVEKLQSENSIKKTNKTLKTLAHRDDVDAIILTDYLKSRFRTNLFSRFLPEQLDEKKEELLGSVKGAKKDLLKSLSKLAKQTKIYVKAGDKGKNQYNLLSLAEGVQTVGGLSMPGDVHITSSEHSLVNDWAPYEFQGVLLEDKDGKVIGYDISPVIEEGDGQVDILLSEIDVSNDDSFKKYIFMSGTDLSAAYKAGKDCLTE